MSFRDVRHYIVKGLSGYMKIPVCLSSQVQPEQEYPFVVYSTTVPYIPDGGLGDISLAPAEDGAVFEERREQPTCTMSFTICSGDRSVDGRYTSGEDEALDLAEKAQGWFLHTGYDHLSGNGVTVVDVSGVQERSSLQVDEEARRYGFDVSIRYVRIDRRMVGSVESVAAIRRVAVTGKGGDDE